MNAPASKVVRGGPVGALHLCRHLLRRPTLRVEVVVLLVSLWFIAACNPLLWNSLAARPPAFLAVLALGLTAAHFILLAAIVNRWTAKPVLAAIVACTALAAYYTQHYHVYLDPSMMRNVLRTDLREASELFSWNILPSLVFYAAPPLLLIWRTRIRRTPLLHAVAFRAATLLLAATVASIAGFSMYKELSALMREQKELRYFITPANYLYSAARAVSSEAAVNGNRAPVGTDAALADAWRGREKPLLLVIVVGETARAANWGLSGYARQTTPELAKEDVINFSDVTACGTNTEVSLPCMFSPFGRHAYDETRIRNSESLLHVLRRAGFRVAWLDNQSGCKGTCADIETWRPDAASAPGMCDSHGCLDAALVAGMQRFVGDSRGNTALVLHQLGNHGPAYYRRYPAEFRRFTPACEDTDLSRCSREEIVNAYDNALLYTDHFLARTIDFLRRHQETHDTAMLYVSDHGESLGENGLFLHGVPYAIAPEVQKRVPMTLWLSPGYAANFAVDTDCLRRHAGEPLSHDHLFHSVLGLLDIRTAAYDPRFDFSARCRPATGPVGSA